MIKRTICFLFYLAVQDDGLAQEQVPSINITDSLGLKQGLFIEKTGSLISRHRNLIVTRQGFYLNDKRIGYFEIIDRDGSLIKRNYYRDSSERIFDIQYFFPNLKIAKQGNAVFDEFLDREAPGIDSAGNDAIVIVKGSYRITWKYFNETGIEISEEEFKGYELKYIYLRFISYWL